MIRGVLKHVTRDEKIQNVRDTGTKPKIRSTEQSEDTHFKFASNNETIRGTKDNRISNPSKAPSVSDIRSLRSRSSTVSKSSIASAKVTLLEQKASVVRQKKEMLARQMELLDQEQGVIDEALQTVKVLEDDASSADSFDSYEGPAGELNPRELKKLKSLTLSDKIGMYRRKYGPGDGVKRETDGRDACKRQLPPQTTTQANIPVTIDLSRWTARQTVPQTLTKFSGEKGQWGSFINGYENSTKLCMLSDAENLSRLQNCLVTPARDFVNHLLNDPANVSEIIAILRMIYGNPQKILKEMIDEVRQSEEIEENDLAAVVKYGLSVRNICANIKTTGLTSYATSPLLLEELIEKLPRSLQLSWAQECGIGESHDLCEFDSWLNRLSTNICRNLTNVDLTTPQKTTKPTFKRRSTKKEDVHNIDNSQNSTGKCYACDEKCKDLASCEIFKKMSDDGKWQVIKKNGICRQCLTRHSMRHPFICRIAVKCDVVNCTGKHHPLMHRRKEDTPNNEGPIPQIVENHFHSDARTGRTFFRYIPVKLMSGQKEVEVMAFLDCGSSGTFLEIETARALGLNGPLSPLHLKFSGGSHRMEMNSMTVRVHIAGTQDKRIYEMNDVHTVDHLDLREQTLDYMEFVNRFKHLENLPITSYKPTRPSILIGLRHWKYALEREIRVNDADNSPIASRCLLGWSIYAGGEDEPQSINYCDEEECIFYMDGDEQLDEIVKHHFSIESLGIKVRPDDLTSKEDKRAMDVLQQTTKKVGRRFETGLLWKDDVISLPDNREMAMNRFLSLEKRFSRDPWLGAEMKRQIDEYVIKGYARMLTTEELTHRHSRVWYLPIFPAFNPNKPDKVRMVYDARAEVRGVSLNSMLLKGPDELASLLNILWRFRQDKVGLAGDIKEMYHQIMMNPRDQQVQRFLFRDDPRKEISTYVLQRMSFGAKCSPSSAQYVKNLNAKSFAATYPRAVESIVSNHYVDDLLDSVSDVSEAVKLAKEVKMIHEEAGFAIRNWKSNRIEVLEAMGETPHACNKVNMNVDHDDVAEKVLGMFWIVQSDEFTFSLRYNKGNEDVLQGRRKPTRREMLRTLMSIYDPMGLLSHFTSYLKVQFQNTWRTGLDWDDFIDETQEDDWKRWLMMLPQIESVRIPRCYLNDFDSWKDIVAELHVFVDASKDCSASVVFIRMESLVTKQVSCSLVGARTRVAPVKLTSIPRLELVAALMGARLASDIFEALTIDLKRIVYWSDSKTVLSWIRSDTKRIKGQFVKFRISEIQESTDVNAWRYVPSRLNTADQATKWKTTMKIQDDSDWFHGPEFLYREEEEWPMNISNNLTTTEEMMMTMQFEMGPSMVNFDNFSRWSRLMRAVAYVHLATRMFKAKLNRDVSIVREMNADLLAQAELTIYRICQREGFPMEVELLKNGKSIPRASLIYEASPYLDESGIIRSRGRIDAAMCVPFETKRPIILPAKHRVTRLIMMKYHDDYKHLHHETVINEFRQKYTTKSARGLLKHIRARCPRCAYLNAKPNPPQMAPLPYARLAAFARPFSYVGIDCMGPLTVTIGRRSEKRWICLFTCLTIRAIHLEILHGMDASSFILAYRNFTRRRGTPKEVYCDNGTNFVGGERLMREELARVDMRNVATTLIAPDTRWKFNPPDSPHMGGSWERLVKSVKTAFYATAPERSLSDPLLYSYMVEIEDIINSRPLTYLPLESEDEESLTPNHFIRGSSDNEKPLCQFSDDVKFVKESWRRSQLYAQRYWKRWVKEYLPELTRRSKWHEPVEPLAIGDLVLIVDPSFIRSCWQKGRIVMVREATDGQVRSAVVKLPNGSTLERPAVKIAKIDLEKRSEWNPEDTVSLIGGEGVKNRQEQPLAWNEGTRNEDEDKKHWN